MLCPFCSREFVSATGLTHHLEGGGCKNASLNRDRVYQLVRQRDPKGVISKKLIGYHGATTYLADDKSWNGYDYECYLCHRAFRQLTGLNQHLASSIREPPSAAVVHTQLMSQTSRCCTTAPTAAAPASSSRLPAL